MAKHTYGAARQQGTKRSRQQKSIAHTEAEVAWIDMYRKRRAKDAGSAVIDLADGNRFHFTKGRRKVHGKRPAGLSSLLVVALARHASEASAPWNRAHPPTNGAREIERRQLQMAPR